MSRYNPAEIEARWQAHWEQGRTFRTPNPGEEDFDPRKPKYYVLDMFPYPSGVGLHVGHPLGYIATDIIARFKRMTGYNVLHPMGYDAFGLPAEQYAVEKGVHPRITTEQNIANMTRQLKRLGMSYDWDRCFATIEPDYYKWTQWIFLKIYNSWFDPERNAARPIGELVHMLETEQLYVDANGQLTPPTGEGLEAIEGGPIGARKWHELDSEQQRQLIDDHRLAYLSQAPVNWCPGLGTVLANEEVTNDGRSERGNFPVYKRPLHQWMMRITAYAQRLADDLDLVDWPESTKQLQRNWIGRSEGARVDFAVANPNAADPDDPTDDDATTDELITVFTTRPDTLFGATYMVLSPEHPLVDVVTTDAHRDAVDQYRKQAAAKSDVDRQADAKEKTGAFTGGYAVNPVNNQRIPIWIADYVLMGYGTGAIMAVPAHDQRDYDFARAFDLPITCVVQPTDAWMKDHGIASIDQYTDAGEAFTGEGKAVNSANPEVSLDGLDTAAAKKRITRWLDDKGLGRAQVQYKLRDWLFSRQRYWGEPFPILHGPDGQIVAVPEQQLPVELPPMDDFKPHAGDDPDAEVRTPLSRADDQWKYVEIDGVRYRRELNTMPQWAGSCWYYLRFLDPKNTQRFASQQAEHYWMSADDDRDHPNTNGVDLYVGGVEHAVLHLLYARFWHKVLYDLGVVTTPEPFGRLFNQGYIQAYAYLDERGMYVPAAEVVNQDGKPAADVQGEAGQRFTWNGQPVTEKYGKMGKSLKNAIAPDEICETYGCDTLRLYEMYMGPLEQSKVWSTRDIVGVHRFLQRLWRNFVNEETGETRVAVRAAPDDLRRMLHKTIKRVTDAMNALAFNVAIAALIELNNALVERDEVELEVAEAMTLMLAPLAPHIAEELWSRMGKQHSLALEDWPAYDPDLLVDAQIELPVQVNGKLRGRITVPADADNAAIEAAAKADDKIAAAIDGKTVRKVIIVKGKLVNIVAN